MEVDKGYSCQNCKIFIIKQKHQKDRKYLDKTRNFRRDCIMLMKILEKNIFLWLIQSLFQQKTRLIIYKV